MLLADLVFGFRQLMKRKVATAAAVLSLGLAIGACTAAFRLIDALLLRPLPVANAERLYVLARQGVDPGGNSRVSEAFEYPLFRQLRAAVRTQAALIAISYADRIDLTYGSDEDTEKAWRQFVSGWMFDSFGLKPALGRALTENDDATPGANPVAVISYDYWRRRFAKDPRVIGRTFRVGNDIYQIVGVGPERFTGTETGIGIDVFVPTMMKPAVSRSDASWFRTFAMLKPGVSARPVLDRLIGPHQAFQEDRAKGFKMPKQAIDNFLHQTLLLEPAASGNSDMQRTYRGALMAIGALVALVLLIACANIANLMTAQAAARAREMAIRVAIGAGRRRLAQLVLVESALLGCAAAALGAALAWWAAPFVAERINPAENPAQLFLPADWRAIGFGVALTFAVTLLFGLAPALGSSAVHPALVLKGGANPHSRRRTMHALIGAQVTFCFVVLFLAGLFVATSDRLSHRPTGFSTERLLTVESVARRPQPPVVWEQAAERLRAMPGVEEVTLCGWPLLKGETQNAFIYRDGAPVNSVLAYLLSISPGWLGEMKIPLLDGRDFRAEDTFPQVAIVNEAFAKTYFDGASPLGKWFEMQQGSTRVRLQIVGLTRDARYRDMREPITPTAFVPFRKMNAQGAPAPQGSATFMVRTASADPMTLASTLRREVPRARPELRVSTIVTQQELVDQHTVRDRLLAMLAMFFAAVALLLAGVGLYGVLDYSVLQRRREIGIRMAIGAQAGSIARLVAADVLRMVGAGALAGVAIGLASVRFVEALLYGVEPASAEMLALPSVLILTAALLAAAPAVVRAVRVDPVETLRAD